MAIELIDTHCHLADSRFNGIVPAVIKRSIERGVSHFIQGGVGPEDWNLQSKISKEFPDRVFQCYGVHPYWVSANSPEDCDKAIGILRESLTHVIALGELGLDFRQDIVGNNRDHQIYYFQKQLEIINHHKMVAVFHFVNCHGIATQLLKSKCLLPKGGIIHSFNSNIATAKKYLDFNLFLSIGGPLLRVNNYALREAVKEIPLDRLLVESDSPDQAPPSQGKALNEPWTIFEVVQQIAEIKRETVINVADQLQRNAISAFDLRL